MKDLLAGGLFLAWIFAGIVIVTAVAPYPQSVCLGWDPVGCRASIDADRHDEFVTRVIAGTAYIAVSAVVVLAVRAGRKRGSSG